MNTESGCSSKLWCGDGENQCPRPVIPKNIATTYEIDLLIKILIGASKNSVIYQTVVNLVDSFKANKLEKNIKNIRKKGRQYLKVLISIVTPSVKSLKIIQ